MRTENISNCIPSVIDLSERDKQYDHALLDCWMAHDRTERSKSFISKQNVERVWDARGKKGKFKRKNRFEANDLWIVLNQRNYCVFWLKEHRPSPTRPSSWSSSIEVCGNRITDNNCGLWPNWDDLSWETLRRKHFKIIDQANCRNGLFSTISLFFRIQLVTLAKFDEIWWVVLCRHAIEFFSAVFRMRESPFHASEWSFRSKRMARWKNEIFLNENLPAETFINFSMQLLSR